MSRLDLAGRVLFLLGSAIFLGLALAHGRPLMALGSLLFVVGSLLYLVLETRQLRARRAGLSDSHASRRG